MNNQKIYLSVPTFQQEFTKFIDSLKDRVIAKSAEYSRGGDAFSNFNSAAALKHKDPREILDDYNTKQIVSYFDMIGDISNGHNPTDKLSAEKLGDIIVYSAILHVMNCAKNRQETELPF